MPRAPTLGGWYGYRPMTSWRPCSSCFGTCPPHEPETLRASAPTAQVVSLRFIVRNTVAAAVTQRISPLVGRVSLGRLRCLACVSHVPGRSGLCSHIACPTRAHRQNVSGELESGDPRCLADLN